MSNMNYEKIRTRLEWHTRDQASHTECAQALAALYIGDGLREIATAIDRATNPTEVQVAERVAMAKTVAVDLLAEADALVNEINREQSERRT